MQSHLKISHTVQPPDKPAIQEWDQYVNQQIENMYWRNRWKVESNQDTQPKQKGGQRNG